MSIASVRRVPPNEVGLTLVDEPPRTLGFLDLVGRARITIVPGAPPMWVAWAALPEAQPAAFASVRHALSGAAKLPEEAASTFERRFGVVIREGYGLTEASPVVTTSVGI